MVSERRLGLPHAATRAFIPLTVAVSGRRPSGRHCLRPPPSTTIQAAARARIHHPPPGPPPLALSPGTPPLVLVARRPRLVWLLPRPSSSGTRPAPASSPADQIDSRLAWIDPRSAWSAHRAGSSHRSPHQPDARGIGPGRIGSATCQIVTPASSPGHDRCESLTSCLA
jgi:hypothetical protein